LAAEIRRMRTAEPTPQEQPSTFDKLKQANRDIGSGILQANRDVGGGILRGATSIGATLLEATPLGAVQRAISGKSPLESRASRIHDVEMGLSGAGANIESTPYQLGKVGTEVAGTLGVGGGLGGIAKGLGAAPTVANALASSGMTLGRPAATGLAGRSGDLALRAGTGAGTGFVAGGAINPEDAGLSAAVGGILPGAIQAAGATGKAIGSILPKKTILPDVAQAARASQELGYVIPPTQVKPNLTNRLLEGMAGKVSTAQNASAKNTQVTNALAAKAIDLAPDTQISPEVLNAVRKEAGKAYEAVAKLPVKPATSGSSVGNIKGTAEINPKDMVFDLRKARNESTAWYSSYQRTADPDALAKAKSFQAEAEKLQTGLEDYAKSVGREDLVPAMIEARTKIAKTYSIEKALNPTTGTVDARKLGAMLEKGKPLSGELKQAAEFANRFPKAAQTVEKMGSLPQLSPLDWAAGGGIGAATGNPLALAAILARPAARSAALSGPVQRGLTRENRNRLAALVSDPELQQLLARTAPATTAR
jgi:hypothetical protein